MKVSNNIAQYSIANNTNILYKQIGTLPKTSSAPVKDTFQKGTYVSAPKPLSNNSSIYSSFNSKQLLQAYSNPSYVNSLVSANPNVKNILESNGVSYEVHPENVLNIANSHITTTTAFALQIANKMNLSQLDKQVLEQACVFHDFGKILIPQEIINKPAALTPDEKKVMDLHAELGYELLSTTGMNTRALNLIKNHHMPPSQNSDILGQILSVADIYSALREERCYKEPLSQAEALNILDQKAQNGEVSTEVVNALKSSLALPQAA